MIKGLIMGIIGFIVAGLFVVMGWLDGWIYFGMIIVGAELIISQSWTLFPVGSVGMLSAGTFTKLGWIDPFIFFSVLIVVVVILAQNIVKSQYDIGHGTSGTSGGK